MHVTGEQRPDLFEDASRRLGGHFSHARGHRLITALRVDGEPLAYAVFTGIAPGVKAELTVWCAGTHGGGGRPFLRAVFSTAFHQWRVQRLSAFVRPSNTRSINSVLALGFEFEAELARWFGNEPGWCFRMFPDQCRWIPQE